MRSTKIQNNTKFQTLSEIVQAKAAKDLKNRKISIYL